MSRFDGNPFDEGPANNPFAAPVTHESSYGAPQSSSRMAPLPPESRTASPFDAASDVTSFSPKSLQRKQKELQAREAQLRKKERELSAREENLGLERPNFPPFIPIIRHDIAADIPEHLRSIQRLAFLTWLGAILALCYNLAVITIAWIVGAISAITGVGCFFMAVILVIAGVPLSYFLWYRRLYNSFKNDSSIGLVLFFISYTSHICWFTLFAIAPPIFFGGYYMCGILTTLGIFAGGNVVIGVLFTIGTGLFASVAALSVVVIGRVFAYFRGAKKQDKLKQEAALVALQNAV